MLFCRCPRCVEGDYIAVGGGCLCDIARIAVDLQCVACGGFADGYPLVGSGRVVDVDPAVVRHTVRVPAAEGVAIAGVGVRAYCGGCAVNDLGVSHAAFAAVGVITDVIALGAGRGRAPLRVAGHNVAVLCGESGDLALVFVESKARADRLAALIIPFCAAVGGEIKPFAVRFAREMPTDEIVVALDKGVGAQAGGNALDVTCSAHLESSFRILGFCTAVAVVFYRVNGIACIDGGRGKGGRAFIFYAEDALCCRRGGVGVEIEVKIPVRALTGAEAAGFYLKELA